MEHIRWASGQNVAGRDKGRIYTLFDKETGETVNSMDGYAFLYQWQYSAQGADIPDDKNPYGEDVNLTDNHGNGDDGLWEDIAGEDSPVYKRSVKAGDMEMRFRCAVTPVKMTREHDSGQLCYIVLGACKRGGCA